MLHITNIFGIMLYIISFYGLYPMGSGGGEGYWYLVSNLNIPSFGKPKIRRFCNEADLVEAITTVKTLIFLNILIITSL